MKKYISPDMVVATLGIDDIILYSRLDISVYTLTDSTESYGHTTYSDLWVEE